MVNQSYVRGEAPQGYSQEPGKVLAVKPTQPTSYYSYYNGIGGQYTILVVSNCIIGISIFGLCV